MPDWTAPFHMPKLTNEQYARQKAEYTAKYGYTISIPGLRDIIKIDTEEPMSALEDYWYKNKEWHKFSPQRLEEVKRQKKKRKEQYMKMLASPTPAIFQNAGSIMTAIDDAQDALNTLAAIGLLAKYVAPKTIGKLVTGPTGLLITAADMLNMVQQTAMLCMRPMYGKRNSSQHARGSPKAKRLKLKDRFWARARLPTVADWIQALQTTDQVFGLGISLGPIIGLMQDIIFGAVRARPGVYPQVKFGPPEIPHHYAKAQRAAKSQPVLWSIEHTTDEEEILSWTMSACLTFQATMDTFKIWNPLEALDEILTLEIEAPTPRNTLTIEVLDEGPVDPHDVIGWPQTGTRWAPMMEIMWPTHEQAMINITNFAERNKNSFIGFGGVTCANEAAAYALASLEGERDVFYDFRQDYKVCESMVEAGVFLNPRQPLDKFQLFAQYLEDCVATDYKPSLQDVETFCEHPWNDIKLLQRLEY